MRLALVAIARNEEESIQRMLDSVVAVADELIVVDTGSTDSTVSVARSIGAVVAHYPWDDNFSNARNFALSLSECPWRLVLDADEWLETGAAALIKLKELPPEFVGQIEIVSSFNDPGHPDEIYKSNDRLSRLLPKGVCYAGAIHEQPQHQLPVIALPVTVGHDGYESRKLVRKGDRNLQLLKRVLEAPTADSYLRFQYARELKRLGRSTEAEIAISAVIDDATVIHRTSRWREDAVCLALELFAETGKFSRGLTLIETEADALEYSVDFWFSVGIFSFRIAEKLPSLRREALARMETSFQYCLQLGDQGFKSRLVLGREGPLARQNLGAYAGVKPDASARIDQ